MEHSSPAKTDFSCDFFGFRVTTVTPVWRMNSRGFFLLSNFSPFPNSSRAFDYIYLNIHSAQTPSNTGHLVKHEVVWLV